MGGTCSMDDKTKNFYKNALPIASKDTGPNARPGPRRDNTALRTQLVPAALGTQPENVDCMQIAQDRSQWGCCEHDNEHLLHTCYILTRLPASRELRDMEMTTTLLAV